MTIQQIQDTGSTTRRDGFLEGPFTGPLTVGANLGECTLYAEIFAPERFDLILRKSNDSALVFALDREASVCEFQLGAFKRTLPIPEGLFDPDQEDEGAGHDRGQVLIEAELRADEFRVRLNGQIFFFAPDEESGPVPEAGDVQVLSRAAGELWSWISLAEQPRLVLGGVADYHWDLPPEALERVRPYVLLSLSAPTAKIGDELTAEGTGFTAAARVEIGGVLQQIVSVAEDRLVFRIAPESESGALRVYDAARPENRTPPVDFRVRRSPRVTGVVPDLVAPGEILRIFGDYFLENNTPAVVSLSEVGELEVVRSSPKVLEVRLPEGEYKVAAGVLTLTLGDLDPVSFGGMPVTVEAWNYIDLIAEATEARWINGRASGGILPFGAADRPEEGVAKYVDRARLEDGATYDRVLFTHPPDPAFRFINGLYADQTVPAGARLFLSFGFAFESVATDGVKVRVQFYHRSDRKWYDLVREVFKVHDGGLERRDIRLNDVLPFHDEQTELTGAFSITVEPSTSSRGDELCWAECRVGFPAVYRPIMELSAVELDFGQVAPDATVDRELRIANTGPGPLQIESMVFSEEDYKFVESLAYPLQIAPGDERVLTVRLKREDEVAPAHLTIRSNDSQGEIFDVALEAEAIDPEIRLSATSFTFLPLYRKIHMPLPGIVVPVGDDYPPSQSLTITNDGSADLNVNSLVFSNSVFYHQTPNSLPAVLAPGQEVTLTLGYAPNDDSADSGTISVYSNDETRTIDVSGGGIELRLV